MSTVVRSDSAQSKRIKRIQLSSVQREQLAAIAGCDALAASSHLDHLEKVLNDHAFITGVFESPKPNEVRELFSPRRGAGLRKKALVLEEAIAQMPWQIAAEFKARKFDLPEFRKKIARFISLSDTVLASYAGEKTSRSERQQVRDRHTVPEIADVLDRLCGREGGKRRDWEYLDRQCSFVTLALVFAGIPCPNAGDTRLGESGQGKLRRLLKAHGDRNRRKAARKRS
jgi:hypothetical protein